MVEPGRWAMVRKADGIVDNIVLWDADNLSWVPPDEYEMVALGTDHVAAQIGDTWVHDEQRFEPRQRIDVAAVQRQAMFMSLRAAARERIIEALVDADPEYQAAVTELYGASE